MDLAVMFYASNRLFALAKYNLYSFVIVLFILYCFFFFLGECGFVGASSLLHSRSQMTLEEEIMRITLLPPACCTAQPFAHRRPGSLQTSCTSCSVHLVAARIRRLKADHNAGFLPTTKEPPLHDPPRSVEHDTTCNFYQLDTEER